MHSPFKSPNSTPAHPFLHTHTQTPQKKQEKQEKKEKRQLQFRGKKQEKNTQRNNRKHT